MRAFVTGATGLLGTNLVHALLQDGHEVKALVRNAAKASKVLKSHERLTIIEGDMEHVPGFAPHLAGSEVLFHTAAYFREYFGPGDHWGKLKAINVDATIALLNAAEQHSLRKVIYTSSSGVIGGTSDSRPADESTPPDEAAMANLYFRSKVIAEQEIGAWLKTHQLPLVHILPTAMLGPSDTGPTSIGKAICDVLDRRLPAVPPGGFEFVDVRDVARAMINAVERGRSGERYILSEGYHSMHELVRIIEQVSGVPAPRLRLTYTMALSVAYMSEFGARLTGTAPQLPVAGIRTMNTLRPVNAEKARRELGIRFRPFTETVRDEVAWFQAHGYTRSRSLSA